VKKVKKTCERPRFFRFFCVFSYNKSPFLSKNRGGRTSTDPPSKHDRISLPPHPLEWFPQGVAGPFSFKSREKRSLITRQKSSLRNPAFFPSNIARKQCANSQLNGSQNCAFRVSKTLSSDPVFRPQNVYLGLAGIRGKRGSGPIKQAGVFTTGWGVNSSNPRGERWKF
jgi:hypothetical protein